MERVFVYELIHDGKRVYIGVTNNPEKRNAEHIAKSNLIPQPFTLRVMAQCENRRDALEIEASLQDSSMVQLVCKSQTGEINKTYRDYNRGNLRKTRQLFVEKLLGEGKSHDEISREVGISVKRVQTYVNKVHAE